MGVSDWAKDISNIRHFQVSIKSKLPADDNYKTSKNDTMKVLGYSGYQVPYQLVIFYDGSILTYAKRLIR